MKSDKIKKDLVKLLEEGEMLPGSIKKQWNVCGMPGCKCKDPKNPQKHGPYFQLSFTLAGKSTSMFVKDDEFERIKEMTERYRKFRDLSLLLVQDYVKEEREKRKNRKRKNQNKGDF
jgi:hypothetical protein